MFVENRNHLTHNSTSGFWKISGAVFILTLATIALAMGTAGCGECRYDTDCGGNQLCLEGRCKTGTSSEPAPDSGIITPPPTTCIEGEVQGCYTGPTGTKGKGECKAGTQTCSGGAWGSCTGDQTPQAETCDGKDNDCNGQIDDNLPKSQGFGESCVVQGQKGPCSIGNTTCKNGLKTCEQTIQAQPAEVCGNGTDDNCNGQTDETPPCNCQPGTTQDCYTGTPDTRKKGACTDGKQTCSANQEWGPCLGDNTPKTETCDNVDNDCNGQIDDGLEQECGVRRGTCVPGKKKCIAGQWDTTCVGEIGPKPETCNGKDDNCDGTIDENLTKTCTTKCGPGTQVCSNGAYGSCNPPSSSPEVCDNKDNDCDGLIDEGVTRQCSTKCGSGTEQCDRGQWINCNAPQPASEICDGKDNDCDGQIDETAGPSTRLSQDLTQYYSGLGAVWNGTHYGSFYYVNGKLQFARNDQAGKIVGTATTIESNMTTTPYNMELHWLSNKKQFAAFWRIYKSSSYEHSYALLSSTGKLMSKVKLPFLTRSTVRFAWNGTYFGAAYTDYVSSPRAYTVKLQRFTITGSTFGSVYNMSPSNDDYKASPAVGVSGNQFGVAWRESRDSKYNVYFRLVNGSGRMAGKDVNVSNTTLSTSGNVLVSGTSQDFLVVYKRIVSSTNSSYALYTNRISKLQNVYTAKQATRLTAKPYSSYYGIQAIPPISSASSFALTWVDTRTSPYQIYAQRLSSTGALQGGEFKVSSATSSIYTYPLVAPVASKQWGVFWLDTSSGKRQVWFRSICGF